MRLRASLGGLLGKLAGLGNPDTPTQKRYFVHSSSQSSNRKRVASLCRAPLGPAGFNSPNIAHRHALHVERTAEKAASLGGLLGKLAGLGNLHLVRGLVAPWELHLSFSRD